MRYLGEKMMFDLKIQATDQPGDHGIARGKIGRRLDLVYSPFILHLIGLYISDREGGMLDSMRQLEDQAQHKAGNAGEDGKPDHPVRKPKHIDRNGHEQESMK